MMLNRLNREPSWLHVLMSADRTRHGCPLCATKADGVPMPERSPQVVGNGRRPRSTCRGLGALLGSAETQLARLAPAVERARQALLGASNALDAVRAAGLRADELAARLAAPSPRS
ncbi:hypothetical protein SMICM17S_05437 [Streptomyces microflavus]